MADWIAPPESVITNFWFAGAYKPDEMRPTMEVSSLQMQADVPRSVLGSVIPYILLSGVAIFSAALCLRLSPAFGVISVFSAFLLMALPGIFIGMALFGWKVRRQPESLIFGIPLGLMLSGYVALMLGYLGHWSVSSIIPAILVLAVLSFLCALRQRHSPLLTYLRPWTPTDFCVLGGMGLAVLAFVAIPFSRVGELTPDGHAYTWLFGWDFICRVAYSASITISLPIDHIHMAGVPLHMYLVGYVLPAFSYTLCRESVRMQDILLISEILLDLVFIGCLIAMWRMFAKSARALLITAFVALIAYSYYGWLVIGRHLAPYLPSFLSAKLKGEFSFGNVSHVFQRLFMVEPQAILALSVLLFVLTIALSSDMKLGFYVNCLLGLAIGIEFGIDSWLGLTLAAWFAGVQAMRLWQHLNDRKVWFQSLIVGSIAALLWATFFAVHMVGSSSGSLVSIHPYWWGLKFGVLQYIIEYGAMLPLGLYGLWSLWKNSRFQALSLILLALIAVSQDLFVEIAYLPHFRIGNRLLPVVLLAGTAWLFEHVKPIPTAKWLALAVIAMAVPTFCTDIHGASDVRDTESTYYVRPADLKACEWIRTHIPRTDIVQGRPDYVGNFQDGGKKEISLIPMFALHRSALGEEFIARSICPGCDDLVKAREADLDEMFRAKNAAGVMSIASKYRITYLYFGPYERSQYPAFLNVLRTSSRFEEIYNKDSVHIFRIVDMTRS